LSEQGKIHVDDLGASERIASQVAKRSTWRNSERARVEPTVNGVDPIGSLAALGNRLLACRIRVGGHGSGHERIGYEVWTAVPGHRADAARDISGISADIQVERLTGPRLENVVHLPVAHDPRNRAPLQPSLSPPERKLVHGKPGEEMRDVVSR